MTISHLKITLAMPLFPQVECLINTFSHVKCVLGEKENPKKRKKERKKERNGAWAQEQCLKGKKTCQTMPAFIVTGASKTGGLALLLCKLIDAYLGLIWYCCGRLTNGSF